MSLNLENVTRQRIEQSALCKWENNPGCIGIFVAEMDFPTPSPIRDQLHQLIDDGYLGYLGTKTRSRTQSAVSHWYRKNYQFEFSPERVELLSDVMMIFRACILSWTKHEDSIVVPVPSYPPFLHIPQMLGRQVTQVKPTRTPEGLLTLDFAALEESFKAGAKMLVLCNPWNPVGRVFTLAEIEKLAKLCSSYSVKVFADEIHAPITIDFPHIPFASLPYSACKECATGFSASKGWNLAGSHCASVILPESPDPNLSKTLSQVGGSPSVIGAHCASTALTDQECFDWIKEVRNLIKDNYTQLSNWISNHPEVELEPLQGTYISWLNFGSMRISSGRICQDLGEPAKLLCEQAKLAFTPGKQCGDGYDSWARFILATSPAIIAETLERIEDFCTRN